MNLRRWQRKRDANIGELLVNRYARVVERRCLEDDAAGASNAGQCEDPEEEAVQDHRHVLPIFDDLRKSHRFVNE